MSINIRKFFAHKSTYGEYKNGRYKDKNQHLKFDYFPARLEFHWNPSSGRVELKAVDGFRYNGDLQDFLNDLGVEFTTT